MTDLARLAIILLGAIASLTLWPARAQGEPPSWQWLANEGDLGPELLVVREASRHGDPKRAMRSLEKVKAKGAVDRQRLSYLKGRALFALGSYEQAAAAFKEALGLSPVSSIDRLYMAESLYRVGEHKRALEAFRAASRDKRLDDEVIILRIGDSLRHLGQLGQAIATYKGWLNKRPNNPQGLKVRHVLAETLAQAGRLSEAAKEYYWIWLNEPSHPLAERAAQALQDLRAKRARVPQAGINDRIARANRLRRGKEPKKAIDELQALIWTMGPSTPAGLRRLALARLGQSLYEAERYSESLQAYERALAVGQPSGRDDWILKAMAWCHCRMKNIDLAAKTFRRMRGFPPQSRALTERLGELYFDEGEWKWADKPLKRSCRRGECEWRKAFVALELGRHEEARRGFMALSSQGETQERGRYWAARADEAAGKLDRALRVLGEVALADPYGYYGMLALWRKALLEEKSRPAVVQWPLPAPDGSDSILASMEPVDGEDALACLPEEDMTLLASLKALDNTYKPRLSQCSPLAPPDLLGPFSNELWLSVEPFGLHSLLAWEPVSELDPFGGDVAAAERTMVQLLNDHGDRHDLAQALFSLRHGLRGDAWRGLLSAYDWLQGRRKYSASRREGADLMAHLGDAYRSIRGGRVYSQAAATARSRRTAEQWQALFPRPFKTLVERASLRYGIDPLLVFAVMFKESAFRRDAVSRVGAQGLMQIMPHTGLNIAKSLGFETFDPTWLARPEVSVEFGAWYLSCLLHRFDGQVPLAIASYNGGPHNVQRWLERKAGLDMDAFIEQLGFTETRIYTRRVLKTYAMYRRIYGQEACPLGQSCLGLPLEVPEVVRLRLADFPGF